MRKCAKITTGLALAIMLGEPALSADAVEVSPSPPVSAPIELAPAATWSGVYVGAFGAYNWGTFDSGAGDVDADGWSGGAFAGYNMQNGSVVYGLEVDAGYSGIDGSLIGAGVTAKQEAFGSVRARIGYAFDPVMIYGTGGIAVTGAEVSDGFVTDSATHLGWTVGAGADALITENMFGRVEYRYSDYQAENFTLSGPTTVTSGFSAHTVNAGVGLKF